MWKKKLICKTSGLTPQLLILFLRLLLDDKLSFQQENQRLYILIFSFHMHRIMLRVLLGFEILSCRLLNDYTKDTIICQVSPCVLYSGCSAWQ